MDDQREAISNEAVAMLAEMTRRRLENKQPEGMGPFAPGPTGVLSPESLARVAAYEELLRKQNAQKQAPVVQTPPEPLSNLVDKMQGKAIIPAAAPKQTKGFEKSSGGSVPTQAPSPQPEATQAPATTEQPAQEPALDPVAAEEITKAVTETVKTPEDERLLNQALQRPTEDGMSLPQKIAAIAMMVAPTAVGFAMEGRKGAYLGAAASGKGLQEGATEYDKQTKFQQAERKLDIEARKAEKAAKEAAARTAPREENKYGEIGTVGADNIWRPVTDISGRPVSKANVPVFNPATQETHMKFEQRGGGQKPLKASLFKEKEELKRGMEEVNLKGFFVPTEISSVIEANPNATEDDLTPAQRNRWIIEKQKAQKLIAERTAKLSDAEIQAIRDKRLADERLRLQKERQKGTAKVVTDKAGDARIAARAKDLNDNVWKPYENGRMRRDSYLERANKIANGINDAASWQILLKDIQFDDSVIRPSEAEQLQKFLPMKQTVDSWVNGNVMLQSQMTDKLRQDIIDYFNISNTIGERNIAMKYNQEVSNAEQFKKQDVLKQRIAAGAERTAQLYANKMSNRVVELRNIDPTMVNKAGQNLFDMTIGSLVNRGALKKGYFVKDKNNNLYIIDGVEPGTNNTQRYIPNGYRPWRVGQ